MLSEREQELIARNLSGALETGDIESTPEVDALVQGLAFAPAGHTADFLLEYLGPDSGKGEAAQKAARICLNALTEVNKDL